MFKCMYCGKTATKRYSTDGGITFRYVVCDQHVNEHAAGDFFPVDDTDQASNREVTSAIIAYAKLGRMINAGFDSGCTPRNAAEMRALLDQIIETQGRI